MHSAFVTNCRDCPLEADGYCMHPEKDKKLAIDTDEVRKGDVPPDGCPLLTGMLAIELRVPPLRKP